MISQRKPPILISSCTAVMPRAVPATLKSMSPRWSSRPWISVSTAHLSSSVMTPMAMPATGRLIGTPASISANVDAQVLAMEVEPLEESTSDTVRMV